MNWKEKIEFNHQQIIRSIDENEFLSAERKGVLKEISWNLFQSHIEKCEGIVNKLNAIFEVEIEKK